MRTGHCPPVQSRIYGIFHAMHRFLLFHQYLVFGIPPLTVRATSHLYSYASLQITLRVICSKERTSAAQHALAAQLQDASCRRPAPERRNALRLIFGILQAGLGITPS